MGMQRTTVTHLQMYRWTDVELITPDSVTIDRLVQPSVPAYLELYNGVGQDFAWTDRNRMDPDELLNLIQHPQNVIHRLRVAGRTAGFSELDLRDPGNVELVYFGLFPDFIGQGLGKFFLTWTLQFAWASKPRRVWVHTCDLDHPAALPNYLRAGFEVFHTEQIDQPL